MTRAEYKEQIKADVLEFLADVTPMDLVESCTFDRDAVKTELKRYFSGKSKGIENALDKTRDIILDYIRENENGDVTGNNSWDYYLNDERLANQYLSEGDFIDGHFENGWSLVREALTEYDMLKEIDPCSPCKMDVIVRDYLLTEVIYWDITDEEIINAIGEYIDK